MTKPVDSHGNRVAGQERNLRVRPAKMKGQTGKRVAIEKSLRVAGDMVAGRVLTRSQSRRLSDVDVSSLGTAAAVENPKAKEKGGQDNLTHSESDELVRLRRLFNMWAKKYKKIYSTENEREERFQIFCSSKKFVDEANSKLNSRSSRFGLSEFADLKFSEKLLNRLWMGPVGWPYVDLETYTSFIKYDEAELEKARIEFRKWKELHKKEYDSLEEENQRLLVFLQKMKRIDEFEKTGNKWAVGYTKDNMDKMLLEGPLKPPIGYTLEM